MKTNWPTKKLGEICDILDNLREPVTRRDRNPGPYPYYGATGVQDYVSGYIFDEDLILVGEDGARWDAGDNSAYKISGKSWVNNHAHVLRPNRNIILDNWLVYFLNVSDLSEYITGTTVKKLNQAKLRSIEIPLPPLEEQKKIVAKLERVLAKIGEAKKLRAEARENTDNLLPAELHKIFSQRHSNILQNVGMSSSGKKDWEEKELGEICEKISNMKWDEYKNESFQYIDLTSVSRESFSITETKEVNSRNAPSRAKKVINTNDVIFGTTRPTLMRVTIIPPEYNNHVCSTGFAVLRAREDHILPQFIYYFIRSERFMDRMENIQTGASYPAVSDAKVLETKIPLPPLAEQKKIVARLDSLSEKIGKIKNLQSGTQDDFTALEQSVLSQAFTIKQHSNILQNVGML